MGLTSASFAGEAGSDGFAEGAAAGSAGLLGFGSGTVVGAESPPLAGDAPPSAPSTGFASTGVRFFPAFFTTIDSGGSGTDLYVMKTLPNDNRATTIAAKLSIMFPPDASEAESSRSVGAAEKSTGGGGAAAFFKAGAGAPAATGGGNGAAGIGAGAGAATAPTGAGAGIAPIGAVAGAGTGEPAFRPGLIGAAGIGRPPTGG